MTPLTAWRLECRLARTLWGLGRRLVELAYNGIEPAEVKLLPTRLRIGLDEYRRNRRTPHDLFCLFGAIRLWRVVYQAVEPGIPGLFPLEQALGIVGRLANAGIPGTHDLIRIIRMVFGFGTAFLRLEGAPRQFFQTPNEGFVSQRPASATVPAQVPEFPFWYVAV